MLFPPERHRTGRIYNFPTFNLEDCMSFAAGRPLGRPRREDQCSMGDNKTAPAAGDSATAPAAITPAMKEFMRGPVTLTLGARDRNKLAVATFCYGCRLSSRSGAVTVFVSRSRGPEVLENLRTFPAVTLVVCRPSTLKALQLKGTDARIHPLAPGDAKRAVAYLETLVEELGRLHDPEDWSRAALGFETDDLVAVTFTPTSVFDQTPGPGAGERVRA